LGNSSHSEGKATGSRHGIIVVRRKSHDALGLREMIRNIQGGASGLNNPSAAIAASNGPGGADLFQPRMIGSSWSEIAYFARLCGFEW
jgi:hypothetical protein